MGWRLLLALVLLFFPFSPARAEEWKVSGNADITAEGLDWTDGAVGPDNTTFRGIYTLKAPASLKYGRLLRFRALPVVQWDPRSVSKNERFFFTPQEGYLQISAAPATIQLGYNVQAWGDTDVFNPLDVVNPRRYYDPLRSEKLGSPTALLKLDFDSFFVEGLFIPVQPMSLIPGEKSRWLPRDFFKTQTLVVSYGTGVIHLPNNLNYHYMKPVEDHNPLKNNFGGRMKFRLPGFDWTLAAFSGADTTPAVNLGYARVRATQVSTNNEAQLLVDPDVWLKPVYYRVRMTGTSFVWVAGDFLVKGASAYTRVLPTETPDRLPVSSLQSVLALERTFSVGEGSLTAMLQGTFVKRNDPLETNSVSLSRMFDRAGMAGLRWAPNERWTVLASFLHDLHFKGDLFHGEVEHKITDGWRAKLSGDFLEGRQETPIGTFKNNDRLILSLNTQL